MVCGVANNLIAKILVFLSSCELFSSPLKPQPLSYFLAQDDI